MTNEIRFPIEVEVNDSDQELCAKVLNGICLDLNNTQGWNEGSRNNFSVNIGICLNALGLFEFEPSCSDPFSIWMDQQDWSRADNVADYLRRKDVISGYVDSWSDRIDLYGFSPYLYEDYYDSTKDKGDDADVIVVATNKF